MALSFQSLRSGSSGNCLLLDTGRTLILIDCGLRTQKLCHALLDAHACRLDAVIVTHAHCDHICYSGLRVLGRYGTAVHCHHDACDQIGFKHVGEWSSAPQIHCFGNEPFTIGDIRIQPIPLPHEPGCPMFGFALSCGGKRIVTCTDFHDPAAVAEHLVDADLIFVEANHDPALLRRFPNYASRFHLSNRKTAALLADARKAGSAGRKPQCVMLGHLSEQRNTESLALRAIEQRFTKERLALDFRLEVAPRHATSERVYLA